MNRVKIKKLSHIFRLSVFTGLGALGLLTGGCGKQGPSKPQQHTRVLIDSTKNYKSDKWRDCWDTQEMFMTDARHYTELHEWLSGSLDDVKHDDIAEQVRAVDLLVNRRVTYRDDEDLYGETEYWASPWETYRNKGGDCEDYVLLKMKALEYLGVPQNRMFFAKVGMGDKPSHAVLLVDTSAANNWRDCLVLSNTTDRVKWLGDTRYKVFSVLNKEQIRSVWRLNLTSKDQYVRPGFRQWRQDIK